jgi:hypothetical protein
MARHKDVDILIDGLRQVRETQALLHDRLRGISDRTKKSSMDYSLGDLCDLGFLCREAEAICDTLRKDFKAHKELLDKVLCMRHSLNAVHKPETTEAVVKGTLASGTPVISEIAHNPEPGSHEYHQLCEHFGMPEEVYNSGAFKLDFKGLAQIVTTLKEDGKPLPPGITQTWKSYTVQHRRNRGVRF